MSLTQYEIKHVVLGRQGGKTQKMLELVGEYQDEFGEVVIVCINSRAADDVSKIIAADYWDLGIDPSRVQIHSVENLQGLRGMMPRDCAFFVDNWDMMSDERKIDIRSLPWNAIVVTETE
jgi:hypothetical protein